jgi:hypothetical protein
MSTTERSLCKIFGINHTLELKGIYFGHGWHGWHGWTAYSSLVQIRNNAGDEKELCRKKTAEETGEEGKIYPTFATPRVEVRRTRQQCACIICDMRIPRRSAMCTI